MTNEKGWAVGAAGALVHQSKVLLVRHTYGEKQGRWALPGGYATHSERLDQTVVREVQEETGMETEVVDLIALVTQYTEEGSRVHVVFRLRPLSGQPVPDEAELDRTGWFSADEVAAMTDKELLPIARHPAQAALRGAIGLPQDQTFPAKSDTCRGFLVRWE